MVSLNVSSYLSRECILDDFDRLFARLHRFFCEGAGGEKFTHAFRSSIENVNTEEYMPLCVDDRELLT